MRRLAIIMAAMLLGNSAADDKIAALGWMSGDWATETEGRWTEEHWSTPRGGVMLGTGRSGDAGRTKSFEFMRIAAGADGRIAFHGQPQGAAAVAFPMVSASAVSVVFENPAHDYPTRISYSREGDAMIATTSGPGGANEMRWRYRRMK